MAKTKQELLDEAVAAGKVADDASPDDYTAAELQNVLSTDRPVWEGSLSASEPIVAPDGHVVLSQDDIDKQKAAS